MVEHEDVARGLLRETVARREDRADDAVHAVRVGPFALLVAQRAVGVGHQVEQLGAERVAREGVGPGRDDRLERPDVGRVGVQPRGQEQHPVQIGIGVERLVGVLIGVAVVEVMVVLVGEGLVARVVAHHQPRVVVRGRGVRDPVEDVLLDGDFGHGQCRQQQGE